MKIKINDTFYCELNGKYWELYETYVSEDKDGKEVDRANITFHPNLQQVLSAVWNRNPKEAETLPALIVELNKMKSEIVSVGERLERQLKLRGMK